MIWAVSPYRSRCRDVDERSERVGVIREAPRRGLSCWLTYPSCTCRFGALEDVLCAILIFYMQKMNDSSKHRHPCQAFAQKSSQLPLRYPAPIGKLCAHVLIRYPLANGCRICHWYPFISCFTSYRCWHAGYLPQHKEALQYERHFCV